MISSTLGAPFGGTTRGGHQDLESLALSLITPPNFGGGGGSCFPSIVVVAVGEPGSPVICWAVASGARAAPTRRLNNSILAILIILLSCSGPDVAIGHHRLNRSHRGAGFVPLLQLFGGCGIERLTLLEIPTS